MDFKEWLKLLEGMGGGGVGGGLEPPVQNPKLGAFALQDFHGANGHGPDGQLPPVEKHNKCKKRKCNRVKFN